MSNSHDKVHYWGAEKSVWFKFYRVEFEEFDYFEGIDFKVETAFI